MKGRIALPAALMASLVALWELGVRLSDTPLYVLPAPSRVLAALFEEREALLSHSVVTVGETLIGLLIAASSAIGIFSGLPGIMQGSVDINVYGPVEYVLLALVILSTTLVIVALITVVSTLAKSVKEATMFLTPLMIVVMLMLMSVRNRIPVFIVNDMHILSPFLYSQNRALFC